MTPRAVHAGMSTWSTPTDMVETTFSCEPVEIAMIVPYSLCINPTGCIEEFVVDLVCEHAEKPCGECERIFHC